MLLEYVEGMGKLELEDEQRRLCREGNIGVILFERYFDTVERIWVLKLDYVD